MYFEKAMNYVKRFRKIRSILLTTFPFYHLAVSDTCYVYRAENEWFMYYLMARKRNMLGVRPVIQTYDHRRQVH